MPKAQYPINPAQNDEVVQCGVVSTALTAAYLRHADFLHMSCHPKLRPTALLGVNRMACLQHANTQITYATILKVFKVLGATIASMDLGYFVKVVL